MLPVCSFQGAAGLACGRQLRLGGFVLPGDLLELVLEAAARRAGLFEFASQGVLVGLGEAAFEEAGLGTQGVAVGAQEPLGSLDAADPQQLADPPDAANAVVVGKEPEFLLPGVEGRLEGRPVHAQEVLLGPPRHVRRPGHDGLAGTVHGLGGRRVALQPPPDGVGAAGGRQRHLDRRRVLRRAAAPGDGLVGEARPGALGAEERPQDALEEGRFSRPVRADDPDRALRREQLHRLPELLVVIYVETLQVHETPGSSLAARAR